MTGAILAIANANAAVGGGGGGGGVVVPGPLEWTDAYSDVTATTGTQSFTLITVPISIGATISGGGTLHYVLNGVSRTMTGQFQVSAGDMLAWTVNNFTHSPVSGAITVTNASNGGAVLDVPNYVATGLS